MTRLSPEDYIRQACDLHLQALISTTHKPTIDALHRFLKGEDTSSNQAMETALEPASPRLFVWIPLKVGQKKGSSIPTDDQEDDEYLEAFASTRTFDGANYGALAFINTSAVTESSMMDTNTSNNSNDDPTSASIHANVIQSMHQIQCMILCPRVYWSDAATDVDTEKIMGKMDSSQLNKDIEDRVSIKDGPNPESITFLSLQMYARHCFVPAVQAMESLEDEKREEAAFTGEEGYSTETTAVAETNMLSTDGAKSNRQKKKSRLLLEVLEDKLRELDVALGQCRRTTLGQIPQVVLQAHPMIRNAAARIPASGKVDLDELGLSALLTDDTFLNQVQTAVGTWINQIRKVTGLPSTTAFPSGPNNEDDGEIDDVYMDLEETTFWTNLDLALKQIRSELTKAEVLLTITILKAAKRFVATIALENNTGMDSAEAHVTDVCNFLRPYPVSILIAARDFGKISKAMENIFLHIPKVRQSRFYNLERCVRLIEASTFTLRRRMIFVLKAKSKNSKSHLVTGMAFDEYRKEIHQPCAQIFERLDVLFTEFTEFILEQSRRRLGSKLTPVDLVQGILLHHKALRERLESIDYFRVQHEKLKNVITEVLIAEKDSLSSQTGENGIEFSAEAAIHEVEDAPMAVFATVDVLDLSLKGQAAFLAALDGYDRRVDIIEEKLAHLLREMLMICKDADDMFRVFGRFNLLLSRTRVQNAVREFQMRLIATVSQSIQKLQSKFSNKFESSAASKISRVRGIPPISGKILWAKQIERQVRTLMNRMGNVLGSNWGQHLEGRQLKRSCDELLGKLDARAFFRAWVSEWEREMRSDAVSSNARLISYPIIIVNDGTNNQLVASVNFKESYELLFREIRQLRWLGFDRDIPRTLANTAEEAVARYPMAMALRSALRSYTAARELVTPELEPLLHANIKAIRQSVEEVFGVSIDQTVTVRSSFRIRWESKDIRDWIASLTELISLFEERVETIINSQDEIYRSIKQMESVEYSRDRFFELIQSIQKVIDNLSLASYANLEVWVEIMNKQLNGILSTRLHTALEVWTQSIKGLHVDGSHSLDNADELEKPTRLKFSTIFVDIFLQNQEIVTFPPIPFVRELILKMFHDYSGAVCSLRSLHSSRYEIFGSSEHQSGSGKEFSDLMHQISPGILSECYHVIEHQIVEIATAVQQWLDFQLLWDTSATEFASVLGDDVLKWRNLLAEASDTRSRLESLQSSTSVGSVTIRYEKVKAQISVKFDSWQRDLQTAFAGILRGKIAEVYDEVSTARDKLESIHFEGGSTSTQEVIVGVTVVQEIKGKDVTWLTSIDQLIDSERVLRRQRYNFPWDWVESSRLKGQYQTLEQILSKRLQSIEENLPILQTRVSAEAKVSALRLTDLVSSWESEKPIKGTVTPYEALETISKFEYGMKKAQRDEDNLIKAKDALGLDASVRNNTIVSCLAELLDIKEVWQYISKSFSLLQEIKDTPFATGNVRKIRQQLEDIMSDMRQFPNRVRLYEAYTHLHETIKSFIAGYAILNDLKTDALKERHWKTVLGLLKLNVSFRELTIGMLWESGILEQKKGIMEILSMAQGEMALEVFLSQVRERWLKQELELVLYQNRTRLIKGWEILYATLDEHMGGLSLMKNSPFFRSVREFQEENKLWEDRLTKLRGIFDLLLNVQRRWVYLEGIFLGTSDIKGRLPIEWSRFRSVDGEFVSLMRRITSRPFAMEILNVENIDRTLERLDTTMNTTQRALGEYLWTQRNEFSRFYFLGDDDLLEIIGNSGRTNTATSHIGKMFSGLGGIKSRSVLVGNDSLEYIDAMVSKDGEEVMLHNDIVVDKNTSGIDWLRRLEIEMYTTLGNQLESAVKEKGLFKQSLAHIEQSGSTTFSIIDWIKRFPAQIVMLSILIGWTEDVEKSFEQAECRSQLDSVLRIIIRSLDVLSQQITLNLSIVERKKIEQVISEFVYERDILQGLIKQRVDAADDFRWLSRLRFKYNDASTYFQDRLRISLSHAVFQYGFEYLGVGDRLVQTPLTDRCYLTLAQALHHRLGGNPFGPAGTGKTETVKALGNQLGRFVVVMNCDEKFDFNAMGRIFCGLCQVGAWGCFDEFNRLEERILSAVSQQILTIQRGLIERQTNIELLGKSIRLHENVGIFVTMNPGYAGRRNLPDNLKNLFRSVAMFMPDKTQISQVLLYSQGFVSASVLAASVVNLFDLCDEKLSKRSHYDFGLRALKVMLSSAGSLRRKLAMSGEWKNSDGNLSEAEKSLIVEAICNNILPKVVKEDNAIFTSIVQQVFPGSPIISSLDDDLKEEILATCARRKYVPGNEWIQKILQLKQVIEMRHGVMIVGSAASGKSSAMKVLLESLERLDGIKGDLYVIDPKAIDKEHLYGELDGTTMEWTDGIFTLIIRQIILNQKGERDRRHWIVFDGDIDPDWAENLNSVLDDNMLLTLPSGERLEIPKKNVRVILEVDNLSNATPATVSRCGLVWMSSDTIHDEMRLAHLLNTLSSETTYLEGYFKTEDSKLFLDAIRPMILPTDGGSSLVSEALEFAMKANHVMAATRERLLTAFSALLVRGLDTAREYNQSHPDFPLGGDHVLTFARRWLLHSLLWSFVGSCSWSTREQFSDFLCRIGSKFIPCNVDSFLFDYRVRVEDGDFEAWSCSVPRVDIESHKVTEADIVIATTDTIRHTDIFESYIMSRVPLILCGPAGSGKTMTLMSTLQSLEGIVVANLSFSSQTTPDIIVKTFRQYCVYKRRGKDIILEPSDGLGVNTWLVIFCDEINLPENDMYGTQRVISFMRHLVEQGGFWREDNLWVKISRIQFVGACNPPSDAGRVIMSSRFLRHAPLVLVDFPAKESLLQIYGAFNAGIMKLFPSLKTDAKAMTEAMVDVYLRMQKQFTPEMQPHYFFSPRELTRWVRGIYGAVKEMDGIDRRELVRLWAHEAQRLFSDRLVEKSDQDWCQEAIDDVARTYFTGINHEEALARPILYSTWMSKDTRSVKREELLDFIETRIRIFYEEELDVPLVVFDDILEHILRIDRVLRQPVGHCLLIGASGTGKTVLSKFVAWMQGLSVFQIKAHSRYTLDDFNEDLRKVLRRVGIDGEKICFIFDETNALSGGFLEAMNALLASGEVPGLFEGENYTALIKACRDSSARDGVLAVSEDELWRRFISIVQRNLHIVFTMNPHGGHWKNRTRSSPALFNRCVVNWIGTWSPMALASVGRQLTSIIDLDEANYRSGEVKREIMDQVRDSFDPADHDGLHHALIAVIVEMHMISSSAADECAQSSRSLSRTYISPRDFMVFINTILNTISKVREEFEDQQLHVNAGISKFQQTQDNVAELKLALGVKRVELSQKEILANQKLQQMVTDQKEAETQRDAVERISIEVERQEREINLRKEDAQRQLDEAEPALLSAKTAVNAISKKDLDEIRNLIRPPMNVQKTLECIAVMLGEKKIEWADVRKLISRSDFIPSILNFDAGMLTSFQIKVVQQDYLDGNDELNYESVMRSSKACGPLYRWAESQVTYSIVHNRIQPLREEVDRLLTEADKIRSSKLKIEMEVHYLEQSIEQYKADYASLIRDVEALKTEMEIVGTKLKRAENLLTSFQKESERWSNIRDGFHVLLQNLIGDSLLISAFLTYSGFFDFRTRASLMNRWMHVLESVDIKFKREIDMVASLSNASERLKWNLDGLSSDLLSVENGVILKHHVRFPLIIDPSGHAIDFTMNKFSDQKIQKTSFQDSAFVKTLTSAIRFGTTLMIENVENIDPIIFPVLNKEIQRTGGRSLIRVGSDEVDYSPKFSLFLCTKNPACNLTPDICSKVTLINFTQTPASLQSQSLSLILKYLSPDIQDRRVGGLKLHSEQLIRLRELENAMLSSISAVAGNILDDDKLVEGMETLTREGRQLEEQIRSCAESMQRVEAELEKYEDLASICRKLFVLLLSMREISFLYEFSAEFLMMILEKLLISDLKQRSTEKEKLEILKKVLLTEVTARSARRMSSEDKMVFCLLLGRLSYGTHINDSFSSMEEIRQHIHLTFGVDFPSEGRGIVDLPDITANDISSKVPLLLCSAPGFDVSSRVQRMAEDQEKVLDSIAMGSQECFPIAESMLATASKRGSWVLLKNCHLCLEWLQETLLRKLSSLGNNAHPNFRLFLTSDIHPKLPASLIRVCDVVLAEAPSGLKASLYRFFSCINPIRFKNPIRNRLYLLVGWLHAVLQERLRFIPKGWSEKYEFMESDIMYALDIIDELFSHALKGRQQIDPTNLPWLALRTILSKDVYGGRISQEIDQDRLNDLVNFIFQPKAFDFNFKLGSSDDAPILPEGNTLDDYRLWIQALPDVSPPSWIGLDVAEEANLSKNLAQSVLSKFARIQSIIVEQDNP